MREKGFSLIEVLLAPLILVFVVGGTMVIYMMSITTWKEATTQITLQRNASITMEKMVRGVAGVGGIREAVSATLVNANTIRYVDNTSSNERSFYLSDGQVFYDPDTTIANDEFSIVYDVRTNPAGLVFAINSDLITISLGLEDDVRDTVINVDLSTKIKMRN